MVNQSNTESFSFPVQSDFEQKLLAGSCSSMLDEILQEGARKMLATAIEAEVADWIEQRDHLTDDEGHKQVVRNGYGVSFYPFTTLAASAMVAENISGIFYQRNSQQRVFCVIVYFLPAHLGDCCHARQIWPLRGILRA